MPDLTPTLHPSARSLFARVRANWPGLVAAFESPWAAYGLLLIFQLKMIWGLWLFRDVTGGDTTLYFANALRWYHDFHVVIAWSPLYTAFFGSFLFINPDPVWATFAHRIVIVLVAALLVLAVFRQLLPPGLAWLCAAWWALLPVGFDTLYEVHLFAVIPVLVSWLLLATAQSPWRRASSLAMLATSAVLVRNELIVAVGGLALFLAVYELRAIRAGRIRLRPAIAAYFVAMLAAALLCGLTYLRSDIKYPTLTAVMASKHRVNMAQVYAFGYKQRHPEWTRDHWTECYGLMHETFGNPSPSLSEMIVANPNAVKEHFAWNLSLTHSGLQLLLFDRATGSIHPDYFPDSDRRLNRVFPAILAALVLAAWGFGLLCLWRGRAWWGGGSASPSQLAWAGIVAVAAVAPIVILTQRPRPSYLFTLGIGMMALTGLCAWAATNRWGLASRVRNIAPVLAIAVVLFTPGYYRARTAHDYRPMASALERLRPHAEDLSRRGVRAFTPDGVAGVGVYLTGQPGDFAEFTTVCGRWPASETFAECLKREKIDLLYLDEHALTQLATTRMEQARAFVEGQNTPGWVRVAGSDKAGERWRYYRHAE